MSSYNKLTILSLIICTTFLYSFYERNKYEDKMMVQGDLILKELPAFNLTDVVSGEKLSRASFSSEKGLFVHFWGTWCAPCEVELPDFVNFSNKLKNAHFLIVAVNDELPKVKKHIKRFQKSSKNITWAFADDPKILDDFGTVKVPETYLFNKVRRNVKKFVGPQDWVNTYYKDITNTLLNKSGEINTVNVESH